MHCAVSMFLIYEKPMKETQKKDEVFVESAKCLGEPQALEILLNGMCEKAAERRRAHKVVLNRSGGDLRSAPLYAQEQLFI